MKKFVTFKTMYNFVKKQNLKLENAYDDLGELHKKTLTIREGWMENQVHFGLVDNFKQLRATELYFIGILITGDIFFKW